VARSFGALGSRVLYHDLLDIPPERRAGATPAPLDELLRASDIVSVHVDERPANRGLCGEQFFARLREGAVFINTSRGFVVDAHACAEFFIGHPSAQALLDVHEPEPFPATYPLLDIRNVHLSPHIAAATRAAQVAMSWVVRDVVEVLSGRSPRFPAPVR
jgi:D-3-phosphoglycerate dehydrogenase